MKKIYYFSLSLVISAMLLMTTAVQADVSSKATHASYAASAQQKQKSIKSKKKKVKGVCFSCVGKKNKK